jgi:hypothetical protein
MNISADQLHILKTLVGKNGTGNVMEILDLPSARFDEGFAIANDMQNKDWVKLLYSNFNKNTVVVELTLPGEEIGRSAS